MEKFTHYICIFCDFTCDEYVDAFNHYKRHMFAKHNCEICDANKLLVYVAHHSDLSEQCDHSSESELKLEEVKNKIEIIYTWINRFLSYQKRILNTTIRELLLKNRVCVECAVCRYLVDNYRKSGGDMSVIQYINDNSVEHSYAHLRYHPNAMATQFITYQSNICGYQQSFVIIRKLIVFVEYSCDTFFTTEETVLCDEECDTKSIITIADSFASELYDSCSQLSISSDGNKTSRNDDNLSQSLVPLYAKLDLIESSIECSFDKRLEKNTREIENSIKSEFYKQLAIKDKEIMKLYTKITEFERKQFECVDSNNSYIQTIRDNVDKNFQKTVMTLREELEKSSTKTDAEIKGYGILVESTSQLLENTTKELSKIKTELQTTKTEFAKQVKVLAAEASPPGTIAYFTIHIPPRGWLKANGQSVSRTTYPNLFTMIGTKFGCGDSSTTFTLPDLRGEFIRCWSDGRDVDKSRKFGSFQWGSNIPHLGHISNGAGGNIDSTAVADDYTDQWSFTGSTFDGGFEAQVPSGQTRDGTTFPCNAAIGIKYATAPHFGHLKDWNVMKGTRPRNIALLACIKY